MIHTGPNDILFTVPRLNFLPNAAQFQQVRFTLVVDSVSQEVDEEFSLSVVFVTDDDTDTYAEMFDEIIPQMNGTIIDANG